MAPEDALPPALAAQLDRLDELVQHFEAHPDPAVRAGVLELLQCVDLAHRGGVGRLAALLDRAGLLSDALAAPEVRLLLDLYELAPAPRPAPPPPPGFVPLSSLTHTRSRRGASA